MPQRSVDQNTRARHADFCLGRDQRSGRGRLPSQYRKPAATPVCGELGRTLSNTPPSSTARSPGLEGRGPHDAPSRDERSIGWVGLAGWSADRLGTKPAIELAGMPRRPMSSNHRSGLRSTVRARRAAPRVEFDERRPRASLEAQSSRRRRAATGAHAGWLFSIPPSSLELPLAAAALQSAC